ncbi:MAG: TlpA family protein disulfide reductase [Thiotrichaceae bacterium]|nr:TlpA family protein disulfide reductase [Thiotrichaceae bacterium]
MKKIAPILIVLILLVIAIITFIPTSNHTGSHSTSSLGLTRVQPVIRAPDFDLVDSKGKHHKLTDYRGKPVIVNFWATWCPPCREELPSMNRAWAKIKEQGIAMIAINVGESEESVLTFNTDYPIDFTVLYDQQRQVLQQWGVTGLPTTFILNPQGKIIYRAVGAREWDAEALLDTVRALR